MSNTSTEALRTTMVDDQTGSKLERSACGTKRRARAAARWETAGVASPPATAKPAPTIVFSRVLRCTTTAPLVLSEMIHDVPNERNAGLARAGLDQHDTRDHPGLTCVASAPGTKEVGHGYRGNGRHRCASGASRRDRCRHPRQRDRAVGTFGRWLMSCMIDVGYISRVI